MVLEGKAITAHWLYMPINKKVIEYHFNNIINVDVETFVDNTLVKVVPEDVTIGSVWLSNDEKIVYEM